GRWQHGPAWDVDCASEGCPAESPGQTGCSSRRRLAACSWSSCPVRFSLACRRPRAGCLLPSVSESPFWSSVGRALIGVASRIAAVWGGAEVAARVGAVGREARATMSAVTTAPRPAATKPTAAHPKGANMLVRSAANVVIIDVSSPARRPGPHIGERCRCHVPYLLREGLNRAFLPYVWWGRLLASVQTIVKKYLERGMLSGCGIEGAFMDPSG